MSEERNLQGLGGWLILVGIGVVISPIRIALMSWTTYYDIFTDGSWELLTTPSLSTYVPFFASTLIFELIGNVLLFCVCIWLIFTFFTKSKRFPNLYISIAVCTLLFLIVDLALTKIVMPAIIVFDSETIKELGRALVPICIWVPYMLRSKRVKATFIN